MLTFSAMRKSKKYGLPTQRYAPEKPFLITEKPIGSSMIFQIYDLLPPLVAKASTARYGAGKAEARNLNVENRLPTQRQTNEKAVQKTQGKTLRFTLRTKYS